MKQSIALFAIVLTFLFMGSSSEVLAQDRGSRKAVSTYKPIKTSPNTIRRMIPLINNDCSAGQAAATADIANGTPKYYQFGRVNRLSTFPQLMQSMYGIEVINMGCVIQDEWKCYNDVMLNTMTAQHGQNPVETVNAIIANTQNPTY